MRHRRTQHGVGARRVVVTTAPLAEDILGPRPAEALEALDDGQEIHAEET